MGMPRHEALKQLTAKGMPYALEEGLIHDRPCRFFSHAPLTLGDLFRDNCSDETFLVFEDQRLTFN
ncbi:MAG: fatty acid--CoA ligase, partial [Proteobacteria bacterium]|nr:fatty acid--CoA ligase [Pseudomonadota bacterium]